VLKSKILSAKTINISLFCLLTISWSFTWFVAKYLVTGTFIMPEILAGYRFLIAGFVLFFTAKFFKLKFKPSKHEVKVFIIAAMFGCSINLFLFYYAAYYLISGFSSVIFSMIIILNLVIGLFFGIRQINYIKIIVLALLGMLGLVCIIASHSGLNGLFSVNILKGFILGFLATVCFSISSTYYQTRENINLHPVVSFAYMCIFGFVWCVIYALLHSTFSDAKLTFAIPLTLPFVLAFLYLAVFGTAVGYLCSFTLVRRIGAVKTGYSSLIVPIASMSVSLVWEHYNLTVWTFIGLALILVSELFALNDKKLK
jgi:probable blue pigment (indigoidine) exporter